MATGTNVLATVSADFENLGAVRWLIGDYEVIASANENPLRDRTTTTGALLWHLALLANFIGAGHAGRKPSTVENVTPNRGETSISIVYTYIVFSTAT